MKKYKVYATAVEIRKYDFEIVVEAENEEEAKKLAFEGEIIDETLDDSYWDEEQSEVYKIEEMEL